MATASKVGRRGGKDRNNSGVWFRPDARAWATTRWGKTESLRDENGNTIKDPNRKDLALLAFSKLVVARGGSTPGQAPAEVPTLWEICNKYLDFLSRKRSKEHYKTSRTFLKDFINFVGRDTRADQVRKEQVRWWIRGNDYAGTKGRDETWKSPNTINNAIGSVQAAFNFAVENGALKDNPVRGAIKRPKQKARATLIDADAIELGSAQGGGPQELLIFKYAKGPFADYLRFLLETGCRPSEAATIEKRHCRIYPEGVKVTLAPDEWKCGEKMGERVIFCNERASEILRALLVKYPEGKLFRTSRGTPLSSDRRRAQWTTLRNRIWVKSGAEALGIRSGLVRKDKAEREKAVEAGRQLFPGELSLYSMRHTRATRLLAVGLSMPSIAMALGTSAKMIDKHYGHLKIASKVGWAVAKAI